MGNKLCKKKVDAVDNASPKSPTPLDRIINRLHLRPNSWKSDSHLNQKQNNRCEKNSTQPNEKSDIVRAQPLSKSSDWTEVDLEVPDKEEHVHLRNPKLSIIFNNENGSETPTPPPRKHKNFREKIEAVAKTGLQAFQPKKPVEEQVCVKKKINYGCPLCDSDERTHNRDHHHHHHEHANVDRNKNIKNGTAKIDKETTPKSNDKKSNKESKRKKNLSVISLPNYNELKLTVAHFDDVDKKTEAEKSNDSIVSLPESKKAAGAGGGGGGGSAGRLDNYITRCRSFGSLFPQQLKKLRTRKAPADIESDDSFGGLEDWDLGLIEHYNPKDASLPRPRKLQRDSKDVMSEVESLVVKEEDVEKPRPPVRRSESLVKKINREAAESAHRRTNENLSKPGDEVAVTSKSPTPPPSPIPEPDELLFLPNLPTEEDGKVEHSSLMKILEQFSIKDRAEREREGPPENALRVDECWAKSNSNQSSLTPSLLEFEKNMAVNSTEEFIHAEKSHTEKDLNPVGKYGTAVVS